MISTYFDVHIGLEIHAQLKTRSKLFCRCENSSNAEPNTLTCPICLGLPGALPVLNQRAVEHIIKLGLACNCSISEITHFDRKNYFYPDLPKGFQITQHDVPICRNGFIVANDKQYKIQRIHLEEDAGKSIHTEDATLLDFNRCGIPLAEIVTEPYFSNVDDVIEFLSAIKQILEYLDISDGNMAEGSLRCDANISVNSHGSDFLGSKVEIKNMNSFRSVQRALEFENKRQIELCSENRPVIQETRFWDERRNETIPIRSKEKHPDYRYFPEPDLPVLKIDKDWIARCQAEIPELPNRKSHRFLEEYALKPEEIELLVRKKFSADYFEKVNDIVKNPKLIYKWISNEVFKTLKTHPENILSNELHPNRFAEFIQIITDNGISSTLSKKLYGELITNNRPVTEALTFLKQDSREPLGLALETVIKENQSEWRRLQLGEEKLFNYFIGQILRKLPENVDPDLVVIELKKRLKSKLS